MKTWQKWALGLGGAGAAYLLLRARGLRVGLCTARGFIGDSAQAEPGNVEAIQAGGLELNLQLTKGQEERSAGVGPVADAWRARGVPVVGWGYQLFRNPAEAALEGLAAAIGTNACGFGAYYANIEEPFWYLDGGTTARGNVDAFARAFRDASGARLVYNGLASPKRLDPPTWALFDGLAPMIYGNRGAPNTPGTRETLTGQWADRAAEAQARGQTFEPYLWAGDLDSAGGHRDYQADLDGAPGQISRCAMYQPQAVWFWYWLDQADRRALTQNTPDRVNLALATVAPIMRDARSAGSSWQGFGQGSAA